MRIGIDAHTIAGRYGGNESYVTNLSRALADLAIQDELILYVTRPQALQQVGVLHPGLQPRMILAAPRPLRVGVTFPLQLKRDGVDLVHVQYFQPPKCPCPVVNTIHDISFAHFPEFFRPYERCFMRALIPWMAKRADAIITVSQFSKKDIVQTYGVSTKRVHVTYPAASAEFRQIENPSRLQDARRKLDLPERFILFVSNIQPRKNLEGLLKAMVRLGGSGQDIPLVVVGRQHSLYQSLRKLLAELNLESRVRFTGYLSVAELVELYNLASVFVYPSFFEGFGIPPIEAMACGTPVIVSDRTCLPEVVGDGALKVNPAEPEEIAQAIRRVLDEQGLAEDLRARGFAQARKYSWERTARKTYEVYCQVAHGV